MRDSKNRIDDISFLGKANSNGIQCGTIANLPASCVPNQGFWATNQSCTNLTGMVGVKPLTPISGVLYRCTNEGKWDAGASPLPYPHPLRGESQIRLSLKAPLNLRII